MTSRAIAAFGHAATIKTWTCIRTVALGPASIKSSNSQRRASSDDPSLSWSLFLRRTATAEEQGARAFTESSCTAQGQYHWPRAPSKTPNFPSSLSVRVHRQTRTFGVTGGFSHEELAYSGRLCLSLGSLEPQELSSAHQRANVQALMANQTHRWNVLIDFGSSESSWPEQHLNLDSAFK
ncbi:hypothetical protein JMJ77_0011715 [Colletotrichum scovillei]|uniref:Uncharacterized protein n=1 Tax=Colletotrichum scovillei TaxID=1209932 RepID=A0A9P7QUT1_9PEZI|nr:hypothetical protein JMJ77_0011715 [Colletotrichum scovillei]KAG7045995.1 hypothetical protein JMJ78_0011065 [Colletotrichum scovillei]KAG7063343.1 hypothetical protein JMJ76_0005810 [Colletotrichum scovillei]